VSNLPEVSSKTSLPGASSSSIPEELEGLRHIASGDSRIHLAKTRLSGCARQKLKKAKASQAGTGGHSATGEWRHA
jgi:hypothetical protein